MLQTIWNHFRKRGLDDQPIGLWDSDSSGGTAFDVRGLWVGSGGAGFY